MSGFGWSGTNAHVVLEGYGDRHDTVAEDSGTLDRRAAAVHRHHSTVLNRRSGAGCEDAGLARVANPASLGQIGRSHEGNSRDRTCPGSMKAPAPTVRKRSPTWPGRPPSDAVISSAGRQWCSMTPDPCAPACKTSGKQAARGCRRAARKVAFAFTGQASQWPGMGEALYASEPAVRARARPLRRDPRQGTGCVTAGRDVRPTGSRG